MIFAQVSRFFPSEIKGFKERKKKETALFNPNILPKARQTLDGEIKALPQYLPRGVYQWVNVFEGYWLRNDQVTDWDIFDVVLIELNSIDFGLITGIRDKFKGTLVATVAPTFLTEGVCNLELFKSELDMADFVFVDTERHRNFLEGFVSKDIHVIPHPVSKNLVREYDMGAKLDLDNLLIFYDEALPLIPLLLGETGLFKITLMGRNGIPLSKLGLFDSYFEPPTDYMEVLNFIYTNRPCILDLTFNDFFTVEAAVLGLPNIGYVAEHRKRLFPSLVVDYGDIRKITQMLLDPSRRSMVELHALSAITKVKELYSNVVVKEKFLKMIGKTGE